MDTGKHDTPVSRPVRTDRLIHEHEHDTYKARTKPKEPTTCPDCGAVFHRGRWQWTGVPPGAHKERCPACHRIHDRCPAGYLTLAGQFLAVHHDEIMHLARHTEEREMATHPLNRIMSIDERGEHVELTTTSMALARSIGDAVHHAYKGELDYQYTDESNILRVRWKR